MFDRVYGFEKYSFNEPKTFFLDGNSFVFNIVWSLLRGSYVQCQNCTAVDVHRNKNCSLDLSKNKRAFADEI